MLWQSQTLVSANHNYFGRKYLALIYSSVHLQKSSAHRYSTRSTCRSRSDWLAPSTVQHWSTLWLVSAGSLHLTIDQLSRLWSHCGRRWDNGPCNRLIGLRPSWQRRVPTKTKGNLVSWWLGKHCIYTTLSPNVRFDSKRFTVVGVGWIWCNDFMMIQLQRIYEVHNLPQEVHEHITNVIVFAAKFIDNV